MHKRSQLFTLLLGLGALFPFQTLTAEDKSSTREGLVKLPSSGGTVQQDDSSFSLSTSHGTASYTIPLPELPSRGGMKPSLSLIYNQTAGDSGSGLGIGWVLNASSIAFNDDLGTALRLRRMDNGDFLNHLALDGQRLMPHASNVEGQETHYSLENGASDARIRYTRTPITVQYLGVKGERLSWNFPGGFIVTAANGNKSYYAETNESAEIDPNDASHTVRWPISLEVNPRGEAILYKYQKAGNRSYLKEVSFAGGQSRYTFDIISTRPSLVSHKAAFTQVNSALYGGVKSSFRQEIYGQMCLAFIGRGTSSDAFVVRAGEGCKAQAEADLAPMLQQSARSLNVLDQLHSVYRYGRGATFTPENVLPKLSFAYSNWNESTTERDIVFPAKALASQASPVSRFELVDYNLDALVDLLSISSGKVTVGLGEDSLDTSFSKKVDWTIQRGGRTLVPDLNSPAFHFAEVNGDAYTDLVEVENGKMHLYIRQKSGTFSAAQTIDMEWITPLNFANGGFRWLDLNNDGLTDLIGTVIEGSEMKWKIAINQTLRSDDGSYDYFFYETTQKIPFTAQLGTLLADESLILSDINGDQLVDLVRVRADKAGICLYENQGDIYAESNRFFFGGVYNDVMSTSNCELGRFVPIDGMDGNHLAASRRIWFLDANGDGILDLSTFNGNDTEIKVWLGFGNGDFLKKPLSFSTTVNGKPQIAIGSKGRDSTRIADIDGDGQMELIIFQTATADFKPVVVIDFNRLQDKQLIKSNLLTTVYNDSGTRYDLRYASSTDELTRDRLDPQQQYNSALHFPMYVVKQLVSSEIDPRNPTRYKQDREVKEMLYHQPVYDGLARKLVGFQTVETILYGDEFLGENSTQRSSYRREVFEGHYRLAGQLKELYVHEFTPHGTFANESAAVGELGLDEFDLHSMKSYTQTQNQPEPGRLIYSEEKDWDIVPKVDAYDGEKAYYIRLKQEKKIIHGRDGSQSVTQDSLADFDAHNLAHTQETSRTAIQGPGGVTIPARFVRTVTDYAASRQALADLEILDQPSLQETFVLTASGQEKTSSVSFEYFPNGLLKKMTEGVFRADSDQIPDLKEPQGRVRESTYDVFGNPTTSAENSVLMETAGYDATGSYATVYKNAVGHTTRIFYGSETIEGCRNIPQLNTQEGRASAYKDQRGICHYLSYDTFGRKEFYQREDGYKETYEYKFASEGAPSRILKTSQRYASASEVPANESAVIKSLDAYTPAGVKQAGLEELETSKPGPDGERVGVRLISYDEYNRRRNITRSYNAFKADGLTLKSIFLSGVIPTAEKGSYQQNSYDDLNRVVRVEHPTHRIEEMSYEPWGHVLSSTYDKADGSGNTTVHVQWVKLDKQVFAKIDEKKAVFRFGYDVYDNLSEVWMPGQTQPRRYVYDSLGRKLQQCAPALGCSTFNYDRLGNRAEQYMYDAQGLRTSSMTFFFDVLSRPLEIYENGKLINRNNYDAYPAAYQSAAKGSAIGLLTLSQSFDTQKIYDQNKIVSYDDQGRAVRESVELLQTAVAGTVLSNPAPAVCSIPSPDKLKCVFTETRSFTLDGAVRETTDPFGVKSSYRLSPTLRFTHLDMELPWQRGTKETLVDNVVYNAKGQIEQIAYRKGSYTNLAYDKETLFLDAIESSYRNAQGDSVHLQYAKLTFDGNGSVKKIEDLIPAETKLGLVNRSGTFSYNERNELVRAERYGEVHEYDYDDAGNFVQNTELDNTLVPSTVNALLPASGEKHSYAFDSQGRLKSRTYNGTVTDTDPNTDLQKRHNIVATRFNGLNQLVYVKTQTREIFFGYDAEGKRTYKRVKKLNDTVSSDSLFPSKTAVVEPTGAQSFVFVGERRVARIEHSIDGLNKGQWYYYLADHLGSTDFLMHSEGTPVEQILYRSYGTEPTLSKFSVGITWKKHLEANQTLAPKERTHNRFTGHYLDDDSGLYYFQARYYDPQLGRFITPDPMYLNAPEQCVDSPMECNLYGYVDNNPLTNIDPTGLTKLTFHVRSFAPFKEFGLGHKSFHGDNRGFTTSDYVTSRIKTNFTYDTVTKTVDKMSTKSDPTKSSVSVFGYHLSRTGSPSASAKATANGVVMKHEGSNPLVPLSPDIDVKADFKVTEADGVIEIATTMSGDAFPNAEAFVEDSSGSRIMLHTFATSGGARGGVLTKLPGGGGDSMGTSSIKIEVDSSGNFTNVQANGACYSVDDWNALGQTPKTP